MDLPLEIDTFSRDETFEFARQFGQQLKAGDIVCFFGGLGAGKTSFIKGLVNGASHLPEEFIQSPTFTILNVYEGNPSIYHFDLYRLTDDEEFFSLGFDEFLFLKGICCIEWAEKIQNHLPKDAYLVTLSANSEFERKISIQRKE